MTTQYRPELTDQIEREKRAKYPPLPAPETRQHGDWSGGVIGLLVLATAIGAIVWMWAQ